MSNDIKGVPQGTLIKSLSDNNALDVEITTKDLEKNPYATERLKSVGKDLTPAGHTYLGSLTTHIYTSQLSREASCISQIVGMENVTEPVAMFSLSNLSLETRKCFHPEFKHKTRNPLDKR